MKIDDRFRRPLAFLGVFLATLLMYLLWARPYQLHWGASADEIARNMPGDEVNPSPGFLATRAITIRGTPAQIWPWLIQMGYGRAGFYGFDLLENIASPSGPRSAERVMPQWQSFQVGDSVPISPVSTLKFYAIQPSEYVVWTGQDQGGTFTWALYPIDATQTRLVSRIRWSHHWTQPAMLGLDLFTEFTDHLAIRKILQGVKGRVEGNIQPASDVNIEFFMYVGTLVVFIWAASSVLRLPLTFASWLIAFSGGVAWLISWYGGVSIWVGAFMAMLVVWAVRVEFRDLQRSRSAAENKPRPKGSSKR